MTLQHLTETCFPDRDVLEIAREQTPLWDKWLLPIRPDAPTGDDPTYEDDFQQMREEVNRLSGIDAPLVAQLAEKLLTSHSKDVRVLTYYIWARLHQDGDQGLAEGLSLLAAMVARFGETLLPARAASRKGALEWLCGSKLQDSLSLYPEVVKEEFAKSVAALALLDNLFSLWQEASRPELGGLASALEQRLAHSGGLDTVVPQQSTRDADTAASATPAPQVGQIHSGRDLLDSAKELSRYLRNQPQGWLSSARLMRAIRWDTLHQTPPQDAAGRTRLVPPRPELRAQLKRLYLQQNWKELLEQTERMFAEGVNHFWLDLQWYTCQALSKSGHPFDLWGESIQQDLALFLQRLPGLEKLAYEDGTPFADEVTLPWIAQQISGSQALWEESISADTAGQGDNAILALEGEALQLADQKGIEAALGWLDTLPGIAGVRNRWLQRLLMARIAEQYGKNEMALHLLSQLCEGAPSVDLSQWEPELLFEVKARLLKLLRNKAQRSESERSRLSAQMDSLLAGLVSIDPVKAAPLCG